MNIAIIYSLPTRRARQSRFVATDEDTQISAGEIVAAIGEKGHEARAIPIDEDSIDQIDRVQADCIVNLRHLRVFDRLQLQRLEHKIC